MNSRCNDLGVDQVLIMIDGEGNRAVINEVKREQVIENHYTWVEAAEYLGCHAIRVNAYDEGSSDEQKSAAVDVLSQFSGFASDYNIKIIVENHGGFSSEGQWVSDLMQQININNCGTLPDFGNFFLEYNMQGNRRV